MSKSTYGHEHSGGRDQDEGHHHDHYWRRVHHHWYFWVAMALMAVAIGTYVMTQDLSWRPRSQQQPPRSSADGK